MYNAKRIKKLYIMFSIILLILFVGVLLEHEERAIHTMWQSIDVKPYEIAIYKPIQLQNGGVHSVQTIKIKSWLDSEKNIMYFFMPATEEYEDGDWKYVFRGYQNILIDGNKVFSGDDFSLAAGEYSMQLDDGEKYSLRVVRSDNVSSLFIELEDAELSEITKSKDNIASGVYYVLGKNGQTVEYNGRIKGIHARGNLSFTETDKKSFAMNLQEENSLLGMDKNDSWTLIANSFDNTLTRNYSAYYMADALGMEYVVNAEYIDLYIDGEYQGNYQLTDKIEISDERIAIRNLEEETQKMNLKENLSTKRRVEILDESDTPVRRYVDLKYEPFDVQSGYLLELEMMHRYKREPSGFVSDNYQPVVIKSPQYAGEREVAFIADRYQKMEDALCAENGYNTDTGFYYYDYIDMTSFGSKYLIDEVSKNTDATLSSFFLYVPEKDGKFYAGPIWDYDKAFGADEVRGGYSLKDPEGLYASQNIEVDVCAGKKFSIYYALCGQQLFEKEYKERYFNSFRQEVLELADKEIIENASKIKESAVMNAIRWKVYGEVDDISEIEQRFLQDNEEMAGFLKKRVMFLDEEWR